MLKFDMSNFASSVAPWTPSSPTSTTAYVENATLVPNVALEVEWLMQKIEHFKAHDMICKFNALWPLLA